MRVIGVLLMAVLGLLAAIDQVVAQTYPQKPIRMLVPWPPGAGTDLMARLVAQRLSEVTGQPVIVDNRSGAGGMIGSDAAAKASPDGYTIIMSNIAFAFSPALFPKMPYDTLNDFSPISLVATQPYLLVVHPSLPTKSIKELVALAKAKPVRSCTRRLGLVAEFTWQRCYLRSVPKPACFTFPIKAGALHLRRSWGAKPKSCFPRWLLQFPMSNLADCGHWG